MLALAVAAAVGAAACSGGDGGGSAAGEDRAEAAPEARAEWVRRRPRPGQHPGRGGGDRVGARHRRRPGARLGRARPAGREWDAARGRRGRVLRRLDRPSAALDAASGAARCGPRTWRATTSAARSAADGDRPLRGHVRRPGRRPRARVPASPLWETAIGDHPKAVIFGSPVVAGRARRRRGRQLRGVRARRPADVPGPRGGARRRDRGRGVAVLASRRATSPRPPASRSGRRRPSTRERGVLLHRHGPGVRPAGPAAERRVARPRPAHRGRGVDHVSSPPAMPGPSPSPPVWTPTWGDPQPVPGGRRRRGRRGRQGRHLPGARPGHRRGPVERPLHPWRHPGRRDGLGGGGRWHRLRHLQRRQPRCRQVAHRRRHGRERRGGSRSAPT